MKLTSLHQLYNNNTHKQKIGTNTYFIIYGIFVPFYYNFLSLSIYIYSLVI